MSHARFDVMNADCLDTLRNIPDCSVDAIVTDPPYGLSDHKPADVMACLSAWLAGEPYLTKKRGFMGKTWDSWVPGPEVWRECFRVLKPGGHILAFAGSRTHDLMSIALRLAGFECRDTVMWVYGSGFPKSMDVSKAIDKMGGIDVAEFKAELRLAVNNSGISRKDLDSRCGFTMRFDTPYEDDPNGWGVSLPSPEKWNVICAVLGTDAARWQGLVDRVWRGRAGAETSHNGSMIGGNYERTDKGEAVHGAARQWQGWGTALKPAYEPVLLFRKPLSGTVAENVLKHGTGSLNIDGCRVPTDDALGGGAQKTVAVDGKGEGWQRPWMHDAEAVAAHVSRVNANVAKAELLGRWPANFIHSGEDDAIAGLGEASRYFYCAKASKRDRDEGLEGFDVKSPSDKTGRKAGSIGLVGDTGNKGQTANPFANGGGVSRNAHPTVKPTDLMRYLCRLITPPNGVILDPFMGSGSTGKAAMLEGFRFIGIEQSPEYFAIAHARIANAVRDNFS